MHYRQAGPVKGLLGEPLLGALADHGDKRVMMLAGILATAVVVPLTLQARLPAGP